MNDVVNGVFELIVSMYIIPQVSQNTIFLISYTNTYTVCHILRIPIYCNTLIY